MVSIKKKEGKIMITKQDLIYMRLNHMHPNYKKIEEAIDDGLVNMTKLGKKVITLYLNKIINGYLPEGMIVDVELMETLIVSRYKEAGYKILKTSDSHLNTVYCFELI